MTETVLAPQTIWLVIGGMAAVNLALRFTPLALLADRELPEAMHRWLSYVPISVMGALVASEVLRPGGEWVPVSGNAGVPAAALTALVFHFTRSFLGATLAGVAVFAVLSAMM